MASTARNYAARNGRRSLVIAQLLLRLLLAVALLLPTPRALATRPIDKGSQPNGDKNNGGRGGCDPLSFPYKTLAYRNPRDCRTYTLFDLDAGCLPNWFAAREVCERRGLELAPKGDREAEASATKLCADNDFTCWLGGKSDPGLCNLMSQDGDLHKQGCHQPVRFVCRDKKGDHRKCENPHDKRSSPLPPHPPPSFDECYWSCRKENSWCNPYVPYCDPSAGVRYENYCMAKCSGVSRPVRCPRRDPPPPPSQSSSRLTEEDQRNVISKSADGYDYRMYDKNASRRMSYAAASKFCQDLGDGWDLVPYWDNRGYDIVRQLCAELSFTCWLKSKETDAQCALMAADGSRQMQGCEQDVRFVCRRRSG